VGLSERSTKSYNPASVKTSFALPADVSRCFLHVFANVTTSDISLPVGVSAVLDPERLVNVARYEERLAVLVTRGALVPVEHQAEQSAACWAVNMPTAARIIGT